MGLDKQSKASVNGKIWHLFSLGHYFSSMAKEAASSKVERLIERRIE